MLVYPFAVEVVGHAGQLDFAMQRFVAHTQQGAIRYAESKTSGGNGGAFHIEGYGAALAETALWRGVG